MKISQRFWNYWFGLYTIIANDDGITFTMKHFFDEVQYQYDYADLKPNAVIGKMGTQAYSNLGWWVMGAGVIVSTLFQLNLLFKIVPLPLIYHHGVFYIATGSLILAILIFATRLIKVEMVWFQTKSERTAFTMRLDQKDRKKVQEMVSFIEEKIQEI